MLRGGHGRVTHAVLPEESVEQRGVDGVGVLEIEIRSLLPVLRVYFIDQAVVAVAVVGDKWRLFFGGHHAWSYVDSYNPLRWPDVAPRKLREDITAMEVIARRGDRWLVAYFGLRYYRMLVGVLDWSASEPTIVQVTAPSALREFDL